MINKPITILYTIFKMCKSFQECCRCRHYKRYFLGKIIHANDTAQKYLEIMSAPVYFLIRSCISKTVCCEGQTPPIILSIMLENLSFSCEYKCIMYMHVQQSSVVVVLCLEYFVLQKGTEICNYSYPNTILAVHLNRVVSFWDSVICSMGS